MNSTKIKLVVINEHTLGCIFPETPNYYSTFRALRSKGAPFSLLPGPTFIGSLTTVRLANEQDFKEYRVQFSGYEKHTDEYEFDVSK